ncbi:MAG: tRNA 4-thiouridine(8) synthase ThiI [Thermoanaerobaculales bacterium]|jgi:thiamine biosynthesis protein ThiI|nr:tRNA 4-thiouridine(8) synthase ThiI [Thermoanaerobaculales bacterium]
MERVTQVLATTNEISLKGGNRAWFERTLTDNVRRALADLPGASVSRPAWRVLVSFAEPVDFAEVARRLHTVFGLGAIMAVEHAGFTLADLEASLVPRLETMTASTFAVRCLRSDKSYPMTSPEIEREVGTIVQRRTGWPVQLRDPELTIHVLVDENGLFTWTRRVAGPGGLPVGVGGRGACLLSGGIDSPVAAYMMMKRGMRLDFIHFHSVPRTDPASLEKVHDLVRVLNRYQGQARLVMVPLLAIQEQIAARCPAPLRVLLYRRFMLSLAERIARRFKARALVTGESLGQVASQTIENLAAVEAVASLPVLRPLIGLDKLEIIGLARSAGTFELSIQPHVDCCSFLLPDQPATKSHASELDAAEALLEVTELVDDALERTEVHRIADAAAWEEIPIPAGAGS